MADLDELRSQFSLTKEEEGGVEVSHQVEIVIHRLTSKFFTKRVIMSMRWLVLSISVET